MTVLQDADLILMPCRSEPAGHMGLYALSTGIPTLVAEDSSASSLVRRLTAEPEYFLVPVTPSASAVKQVWYLYMCSPVHPMGP